MNLLALADRMDRWATDIRDGFILGPDAMRWLVKDAAALRAAHATIAAKDAEIERMRERMTKLHKFSDGVLREWPDVGMDGFDIQELAIECGLLAEKSPRPTEQCGECCNCAEYFSDNEWVEGVRCYRKTAALTDPVALQEQS